MTQTSEPVRTAAWPGYRRTTPGWLLTAATWLVPLVAIASVVVLLEQDVAPLRLVLPVAAIVLVMAVRPKPSTAIAVALVVIPVGALLRRLTGGAGAFVPSDPLALLALVAAVPAFAAALTFRRRSGSGAGSNRTAGLNWFLAYIVWVLVTSVLGLLGALFGSGGSLFARITGLVIVIVPAGVGYLVASGRVPTASGLATRSLIGLPVLAAGYAVVQFFDPPAWDLAWLRSVSNNLTSVGVPEPQGFRVWGPLEAPLPLATYCGLGLLALLVVVVSRRGQAGSVARALACTVGALVLLIAILLTSVRSVLFLLPLLLAVMVLLDLIPGARRYGVLLLVVVVGGTAVGIGTLGLSPDGDTDRYAVGELSEDQSFQERADLLPNFIGAFSNPFGGGAGTSGLAQRLEANGVPTAVDNGYLTLAIEGGLVQLVLFCGVVGIAIARAARHARQRPTSPTALLGILVLLYFALLHTSADVVSDSLGLIFWIFVGAALAPADPPDEEQREHAGPGGAGPGGTDRPHPTPQVLADIDPMTTILQAVRRPAGPGAGQPQRSNGSHRPLG